MPSNRFFIQHCMPSSVDAPRVGRGSLATHARRIRSQLRQCDQRCWPFSIRSWIGTQHRQPERVHPPDHTSTHPGTHPQRLDVVDPAVGRLAAQLGARLCGAGASKETSAGTTAVAATAAPAETAAAEQPWPPQAPISTESGNLQLATFSKRCSTPHSGCRSGQGRCRHIPPALLPAPPRPPAAAPPAAVAPAAPPAGQVVHAGRLSYASNAYDCRQRAHPQASARRAHGPHSAHSQLRKQSHQRRGRGSMHTQAASQSVGLKRPWPPTGPASLVAGTHAVLLAHSAGLHLLLQRRPLRLPVLQRTSQDSQSAVCVRRGPIVGWQRGRLGLAARPARAIMRQHRHQQMVAAGKETCAPYTSAAASPLGQHRLPSWQLVMRQVRPSRHGTEIALC